MGDVVIPSSCIDRVGATRYFFDGICFGKDNLFIDPTNLEYINRVIEQANKHGLSPSLRKVFCTDTIIGEYLHIDAICGMGAEIIEMETSAFYTAAKLMEKTAIAFLVVSDNPTLGDSLSAPRKERFEYYNNVIRNSIPQLIDIACNAEL